MDVSRAIEERRAVKHFDPNYAMSDEEIDQLMSLALLAPTSFNIQNWRFVMVQDTEQRKRLREVAWNQSQVTDASLLLVLCGDLKAWEKTRSVLAQYAGRFQAMIVKAIDAYYGPRAGVP